jgi:hypothetical protein
MRSLVPPPPPLQMPYRVAKRRIIVKLRPDIVAAMDSSANGLRFARPTGLPNAAVYNILDGTDVHEKARQIARLPGASHPLLRRRCMSSG